MCRRLAYVRSRLLMRRRLAYVRSRLLMCRRLAHVWSRLSMHRRLAYVRSRLLMRQRLAYVRSRLLMCRRLAHVWSRLSMHRRLAYVRSRLLMRQRTRSVVIVKLSARCAGTMRGRLAPVRASRSGSVVWARDVVGIVRVRCSTPIWIGRVRTRRRPRNIVVYRPRRLCVTRIVRSRSVYRGIVRHWSITRPDHAGTVEGRWFSSCGHLRPAVVHRRPLGAVGARHLLMPGLHLRGSDVAPAHGGFLSGIGARVDSPIATVIGDAIHGDMVHYRSAVNIVNAAYIHAIDVPVVIKITTAPVAAFIAVAVVAVTVIDPAIEAYLRTPISGMPEEGRAAPSPVARRPQKADLGGQHPRSGYPEIAFITIRPVTWSPNVARPRAPRLLVHRQRRRRDRHRDEHCGK